MEAMEARTGEIELPVSERLRWFLTSNRKLYVSGRLNGHIMNIHINHIRCGGLWGHRGKGLGQTPAQEVPRSRFSTSGNAP